MRNSKNRIGKIKMALLAAAALVSIPVAGMAANTTVTATAKLMGALTLTPTGMNFGNITFTGAEHTDGVKKIREWIKSAYDGKDAPVTGSMDYDTMNSKLLGPNIRHAVRKKAGKEVQTVHSVVSKDGKHYTSTTTGVNGKGQKVNTTAVYDRQ